MAKHALFQLGMDLEAPRPAQTEDTTRAETGLAGRRNGEPQPDFFIVENGVRCAGKHLIIDLHGARGLDDRDGIEDTLRRCVEVSGATLLHIHLHHFEPNGGVSGVAVLAESHISIHTWPENGYAALDVFMCGQTEPEACVAVLREAFRPGRVEVQQILRGRGA